MRKFVCVCVAVMALTAGAAGAAQSKGSGPSAEEMKKMGIFLSNFTEVGLYDIDVKEVTPEQLIHFGIWHNYINNKKSTIKRCKDKDCEWGESTVPAKSVAASVRRYFDLKLKHQDAEDPDFKAHYDGSLYHFAAADGGVIYYADVQKVSYAGDNTLRMTGELYDLHNKKDRPATFTALAKPHKWNDKNTWAILSLSTEWK